MSALSTTTGVTFHIDFDWQRKPQRPERRRPKRYALEIPERVESRVVNTLSMQTSNYVKALRRLMFLSDPALDDYDEEFLAPTSAAIMRASHLLDYAAQYLGARFPYTLIYPDGRGGLSIEWRDSDCVLNLDVSDADARLFHSYEGRREFEPATENNLISWLSTYVESGKQQKEYAATS